MGPLFPESKILKFEDLYKLEVCKFMYDNMHDILPKPLAKAFKPNNVIHGHDTRQSGNPHVAAIRTMVAKNSISHKSCMLMGSSTGVPKTLEYPRLKSSILLNYV